MLRVGALIRMSKALWPASFTVLSIAAQVLQRGLPRPSAPELVVPLQPEADASTLSYEEAADQLLRNELAALVKYDNAAYPIKVSACSAVSPKPCSLWP